MADPDGYGSERALSLPWGGELRAPAYPIECDYVRIVRADGTEALYWNSDEWHEEPADVMGAIVGACLGGPVSSAATTTKGARP